MQAILPTGYNEAIPKTFIDLKLVSGHKQQNNKLRHTFIHKTDPLTFSFFKFSRRGQTGKSPSCHHGLMSRELLWEDVYVTCLPWFSPNFQPGTWEEALRKGEGKNRTRNGKGGRQKVEGTWKARRVKQKIIMSLIRHFHRRRYRSSPFQLKAVSDPYFH